jgi:hypothetical protein
MVLRNVVWRMTQRPLGRRSSMPGRWGLARDRSRRPTMCANGRPCANASNQANGTAWRREQSASICRQCSAGPYSID